MYINQQDAQNSCEKTSYNHTTARRTGIYQMWYTAYKVVPDNGLIQSETCRASNRK